MSQDQGRHSPGRGFPSAQGTQAVGALGVPGGGRPSALPFSRAEGRKGDGGGGGNPGSPLLAAAPTASAQASSAPRTEPGPVACCALPAERRHLSAAFANLWGAPGDPGGEGGGPHPPPQPRSVWTALGTSRKGAGRGWPQRPCVPAERLARLPGAPPPPPPRICSVAGGMEMSVCCCLTHPDLIDFFSADKRPLMSSFSSY